MDYRDDVAHSLARMRKIENNRHASLLRYQRQDDEQWQAIQKWLDEVKDNPEENRKRLEILVKRLPGGYFRSEIRYLLNVLDARSAGFVDNGAGI